MMAIRKRNYNKGEILIKEGRREKRKKGIKEK